MATATWKRKRSGTKAWRMKVVEVESKGEIDESTEQLYQEALHEAAQTCGSDHPEFAEAAGYLADLYMFLGRHAEAEALYRRALKIYKNTIGDEHMIYSMALRNLAAVLELRGKADEATRLRYEARGIFG